MPIETFCTWTPQVPILILGLTMIKGFSDRFTPRSKTSRVEITELDTNISSTNIIHSSHVLLLTALVTITKTIPSPPVWILSITPLKVISISIT